VLKKKKTEIKKGWLEVNQRVHPVGKIAEKSVCTSFDNIVCILSAELTKNALFQTVTGESEVSISD